jgi:hypothetical protein
MCIFAQTKTDRRHACVIHSAMLLFSFFKLPNGFSLLADSFLKLYVISPGFVAANMELSGTTRQVPSFGI